jgi:hypothetical protein
MKGFLDHLAGMALGAKQDGGARPSLPSRFVPRPSAIGARDHGLGPLEEAGTLALTNNTGERGEPDRETARIGPPVAIAARREGLPFEFPSKQVLPRMEAAHPPQTRSGFEGVARPSPRRPFVNAANESAIQTHYRPSSAYQVSVVLIEGVKPAVSPLPVLSRGKRDTITHRERGVVVNPDLLPPLPTLFTAATLVPQTGARLNDQVVISGVRLAGAGHVVRLIHRLFAQPFELAPIAVDANGASVTIRLPNDAAAQSALAAGQLAVSVRFTPTGEPDPRETNAIPLILAPAPVIAAIGGLGLPAATAARGGVPPQVTITMASRPQVRLEQSVSLVLDSVEARASPRAAATDLLVFNFPNSVALGPHWVRLRVDGADSILLDRSGPAPVFDNTQQIAAPP